MDRLATWLESDTFRHDDPELNFALTIASAVYAHLYLAWIHPFGDGNGRTARLLEFMILARSGYVPLPAAHLMSNHYNLTRDRYYRELDRASVANSSLDFMKYAIEGFVDGIRDQIDQIKSQQMHVAWINYVHDSMSSYPSNSTRARRIDLALAMKPRSWYSKAELAELTTKLAHLYGAAGERTLPRDLNTLKNAQLVTQKGRKYSSNFDAIAAFLPPMADDR